MRLASDSPWGDQGFTDLKTFSHEHLSVKVPLGALGLELFRCNK